MCVFFFVFFLIELDSNRELKIRISEHKIAIRNNGVKSSVARHKHDVGSLRFTVGEVMEMPPKADMTLERERSIDGILC